MPESRSPKRSEQVAARTALFVSTQHWRSPFRIGSHHIAREFARRGWRVGFVSAPVSPLHLLGFGEDRESRLRAWKEGGSIDARTGVWTYVPFTLLPVAAAPLLRGVSFNRMAWRTTMPSLRSLLASAGFLCPDVGYTDHFLHEGALGLAAPKRVIFRIADRLAAFPGAGPDFDARASDLAARSDVLVCTHAGHLQQLRAADRARALVIGNGVHLDHLQAPQPAPPEYLRDSRPKAVYAGALERWVDAAMLEALALASPELQVVAIGPAPRSVEWRLRAAGVAVLGARPHEHLPAYLQHAHVGLVPFRDDDDADLVADVEPLKAYEYLACGLPVVGTGRFRLPEQVRELVERAQGADDFIRRVQRLARGAGPERRKFADLAMFDWSQRLSPLFARLAESGAAG